MNTKEKGIALERAGLLDQIAERIEKKDFVVLFGITVSDVIRNIAVNMRDDAISSQKKKEALEEVVKDV
jgi:hypothetical protein